MDINDIPMQEFDCRKCERFGGAMYAQCKPGPKCDMKEPKPSGWEAADA